MFISLISELSLLCFSNRSVVIPPSGIIDIMMERSNRTREAFVSPNHSGLCWKQRDRGGGGGRDRKIYTERERQQKLLFDFLWLKGGRKEIQRRRKDASYSGCPAHQPCSRQTWQHGNRRSTQRPSLCFFPCLPACQRHLWAWRGPADTERLPHHMPVCFSLNLMYLFMALVAHTG